MAIFSVFIRGDAPEKKYRRVWKNLTNLLKKQGYVLDFATTQERKIQRFFPRNGRHAGEMETVTGEELIYRRIAG